jgi:thiosulfate/3-mercaptopyruvate sulfurtransferase
MKFIKSLFVSMIMFAVSTSMFAQQTISVDDLAKDLRNSNLVIIAAGPESEYNKSHITGSISLPYTAFDKTGDIEGLLVSDAEIAKMLGDKGISEKSTIVVYDEFDSRYAARIYSLLKYMGAKDVKILDGGFDAWKKGRKPLTRNPSNLSKTTFTATIDKSLMVSMQDALAAGPKADAVLIDTRSPGEFQGKEQESKGRLAGSINIEYKELLDANGMLKPKAELEKVYTAKGVTKDKEIVLYCSSGVRTGLHHLALRDVLGFPKVKIYDGGYNEVVAKSPDKIVK